MLISELLRYTDAFIISHIAVLTYVDVACYYWPNSVVYRDRANWTTRGLDRSRSRSPRLKAQYLRERTCQGKPDDTLPWAVQKWLNWLRCCLGCGLGWSM